MDDPLEVSKRFVVDHTKLVRWCQTDVPEYNIVTDDPEDQKTSPFVYNEDINKKLIIWYVILSRLVHPKYVCQGQG